MDFDRIDYAVRELSYRRCALGDVITAYNSADKVGKAIIIEAILQGLDEIERVGSGFYEVVMGERDDAHETAERVQ